MNFQGEKMISVIVPIYQIEEYLPQCIESIQKQTYSNLEIILVDDGSQDGSARICDQYAAEDSRIKVIHKANGGLVSARIAGIEIATGEYVTYVDGDDWIDEGYYEGLIKKADHYKVDIVMSGFTKNIGNIELPNYNEMPCGYYAQQNLKEKIYPIMFYDANAGIPGVFTYVWNKLFRRELIYSHQIAVDKNISIGEDAACVYPALLFAKSIYIDKSTGYHYRQRTGSMLKKNDGSKQEFIKLKTLFDNLSVAISTSNFNYDLKDGLQWFMRYMIVSRTGGVFENKGRIISAYEENIPHHIIIYGAGNIGQHLYSAITTKMMCSVKNWIDPDFAIYQQEGLPVDDYAVLENYTGEVIFVAHLRKNEIHNALEKLEEYNIPHSKIILLDLTRIDCSELLP